MRSLFRLTILTVVSVAATACYGSDGSSADPSDGSAPAVAAADAGPADSCSVWSELRGIIGSESPKIRREGDKVFVWAGGDESGPGAEWYDFTDAPMPPGDLQYGIGKDRIRSIDDPVFVAPTDPRLTEIPASRYRRCERPENADEIMVIGYVAEGQARAYPTALMDRHEIVNDQANGKPFTVGW